MKKTRGDCYQASGHLIMDDSNFLLCHGNVLGRGKIKGKRIGHAWCEVGDVIFDFSNGKQKILRKETYYKIGKIKDVKKYTGLEACKMMLKTGTFGPWEKMVIENEKRKTS